MQRSECPGSGGKEKRKFLYEIRERGLVGRMSLEPTGKGGML